MCEYESRNDYHMCGRIRNSEEVSVMEMEQRNSVVGTFECNNQNWEDYMKERKAFQISQNEVLNTYGCPLDVIVQNLSGVLRFQRRMGKRDFLVYQRLKTG